MGTEWEDRFSVAWAARRPESRMLARNVDFFWRRCNLLADLSPANLRCTVPLLPRWQCKEVGNGATRLLVNYFLAAKEAGLAQVNRRRQPPNLPPHSCYTCSRWD
jgi:hypothetical protein